MLSRSVQCTITCERHDPSPRLTPNCTAKPIELDHEPETEELIRLLAKHGYATDDQGRHWCARHDPAYAGLVFEVGKDYQQLAPGLWVRAAAPAFPADLGVVLFGSARIEVRAVEPGMSEGCDGQQ